jgi:putative transposase
MKKNDFDSNNHAVFKLMYHLVLIIKYRRRVLNKKIQGLIIKTFREYSENHGIILEEANGEEDHIHFLFRAPPNINLSSFINVLKTQTSRRVRKNHWEEIKSKLWKDKFWSQSYILLTCGGAPIEVIRKYIEDQGKK